MKFTEALEQIEHKKLRRVSWPEHEYIYTDKNIVRKQGAGWNGNYVLEVGDLKAEDWETV